MGAAHYDMREFRFIIEDELTQAYVYIRAWGDVPLGVQGWHHKTYPASKSVLDILNLMASGKEGDDPLLWSHEAPPQ